MELLQVPSSGHRPQATGHLPTPHLEPRILCQVEALAHRRHGVPAVGVARHILVSGLQMRGEWNGVAGLLIGQFPCTETELQQATTQTPGVLRTTPPQPRPQPTPHLQANLEAGAAVGQHL